ncbi:MAG: DNA repair protein RadA [Proteobacteria bacterium]|nr:DNA repair protein RadA [Pseudomonadota bacterium]
MGKKQLEYLCEACGARSLKWAGRCTNCGEWDSLKEFSSHSTGKGWVSSESSLQQLDGVRINDNEERWFTEVKEFDRVIGGGFVKGSIGLLGGTPGVGKSTLILQLLARLTKLEKQVLYVSGEESAAQIKQRANRLVIDQKNIAILIESNLEQILGCLQQTKPEFIVIDSIQTLYTENLTASAGSVSQVRETASALMQYAKKTETSVMLIGHVTKDGDIAGPRTLEHMVDYVLYLEGEKKDQHRVLRSVKNRFGNINEIGLFKMTEKGLSEVAKPGKMFAERFSSSHPGTAIFAANEGTRTLFLEVQVLVGDTQQNYPARTTVGTDRNRLQVILAVLEKHLALDFSRNDIYVNLAGGIRVMEPAIDLCLIAAILSSHLNIPLPRDAVFCGEVALTGEFRAVSSLDSRLNESERCGFKSVFYPDVRDKSTGLKAKGIKLHPVKGVQHLMDLIR